MGDGARAILITPSLYDQTGQQEETPGAREKIDKHDPEKPAFLRKIMD